MKMTLTLRGAMAPSCSQNIIFVLPCSVHLIESAAPPQSPSAVPATTPVSIILCYYICLLLYTTLSTTD
jgi:hypothetical protein